MDNIGKKMHETSRVRTPRRSHVLEAHLVVDEKLSQKSLVLRENLLDSRQVDLGMSSIHAGTRARVERNVIGYI